jgi:hypothetical protein
MTSGYHNSNIRSYLQLRDVHVRARQPFAVLVRHRCDTETPHELVSKDEITLARNNDYYERLMTDVGVRDAPIKDDTVRTYMPVYMANHTTNKNAEHSENCTLAFCHFAVPNDLSSPEPSSIKSVLASGKDTSSLRIDASVHFGGLGAQIRQTAMYGQRFAPADHIPAQPDAHTYYNVYDRIDPSRTVCVPYASEWHGRIIDGHPIGALNGFDYLGEDAKSCMNLKNCRIDISFMKLQAPAYELGRVQHSAVASMLRLDMKFADFIHSEMMRTLGEEVRDETSVTTAGTQHYWKFPLYFHGCSKAFTSAREKRTYAGLLNGRT